MRSRTKHGMLAIGAAVLLANCAAAGKKPEAQGPSVANSQLHAGWYIESAGQGRFQPCGQSRQWRVTASADLPAQAKAFGLQQETPVYVRLTGSVRGDEIAVARVEQFGSPTPVRNCGMDGVVIPARASAGG